jgi:Raf kinase inhibitor-like YbhB/YbcL family protein
MSGEPASPFINSVKRFISLIILAGSPALLVAQKVPADDGSPEHLADVQITSHIFKPAELRAPRTEQLHVPKGFRIEKFAENVGNARILAVSPDGSLYVTRREQGDVLMFKVGPNGLPTGSPVRVASRAGLHGIAFSKGKVYLASVHEIFKADVLPDGTFGPLEMIIHDLPDAGQHNTRTVQIGPDDMMYISVGSTCNECAEPNPENATILRATLDGTTRSVFASGLRDTVGWGWHPKTGELWGMDNGMDGLGDSDPPEELNHIEKGKKYGWPYVYADNKINPHLDPPGGIQKSDWAKVSEPMVLGYTPHAAPMQMSFYDGNQFPAEFIGDAFVSFRGSWNRKPASGYEVARIRFRDGKPVSIEPFVTGFVGEGGESARPMGNVIARDGSLLFTDDRNGVIYRVSYTGGATAPAPSVTIPPESMLRQNKTGVRSPLAVASPQAQTTGKLVVTSVAFHDGQTIPVIYSSYDQSASPPLQWTAGPQGTQSYVLLMEDPDAKTTPLPVIHWVVWNIPANVTNLREGLEPLDRLEDPMGLRQGGNSMGTVGYKGPRPPSGDAAHHYHIELFALDQKLALHVGASRDDVLNAMHGHVLASGELTGLFARPPSPAKP